MIDIGGWLASGDGLITVLAVSLNLGAVLRMMLLQHGRLQVERERSARIAGIVRSAGQQMPVRVDEQDGDGRRVVEVGPVAQHSPETMA
ncbi:hypothetical protein Q0Z83_103010 [Actinoplanes sichuanensis]|uniref:Uncharacterized protein n=1 Tax=Actinoplanes sichuanensis TaxID=512349 RepID=A0ABW4AJJ8_9ACTN|nr:hypothetical protein [Actinoplanes sichuanensis]BEL12110.1 hypothetical protein Q0Z83_103010 [Actinoplanes sichuanensis]